MFMICIKCKSWSGISYYNCIFFLGFCINILPAHRFEQGWGCRFWRIRQGLPSCQQRGFKSKLNFISSKYIFSHNTIFKTNAHALFSDSLWCDRREWGRLHTVRRVSVRSSLLRLLKWTRQSAQLSVWSSTRGGKVNDFPKKLGVLGTPQKLRP